MITKINRKTCLEKYPNFPLRSYDEKKDDEIYFYPKVFASYVITMSSKSLNAHMSALGKGWQVFAKALNFETFIFLGDTVTPWLCQSNDYKPVRKALDFLIENKIGKKFNGAIEIDIMNLPVFVKHLSWIIRCNAALPYIYFMDKEQSILATICQYGNIHINTMDKNIDKVFNYQLKISTFKLLKDNVCNNQFEKSSAIKGREIKK